MQPERWQRVRAVFEQAVDLDGEARRSLLQHELANDDEARAEVERLLAASPAPSDYLQPPGPATLAGALLPGQVPRPGDRVGVFALQAEIGRGGQGSVWRALDTRLGRTVAVKLLPAGMTPAVLARFRREAAITSRLDHPGICTVHDFDLDGDQPFVAMCLVPGESLQQHLDRARSGDAPLAAGRVLGLLEQAARALHAAHRAGVVHRDVKPGNLMLTPDDQVVVLDFGIAFDVEDQSPALTRTGDVLGTPTYMAPEQVEGRPADARSDVWALGVVLFEALLLRPPFHGPTREALYRAILSHEPVLELRSLPRDLRVVLATALTKEPQRRYATALDLAADLAACREGRPIAARPIGHLGRLLLWTRREPRAALLAAGLVLALLGSATLTGYLLAQQNRLDAGTTALAQLQRRDLMRDLSSGLIRLGKLEPELRAVLVEDPKLTAPRAVMAISLATNGRIDDALALCDAAPADSEYPRALTRARSMVLRIAKRDAEADTLETGLGSPQSALEAYIASLAAEADGKPNGPQRERDAIRLAILLFPGQSESYLHRLIVCTHLDATTRDDAVRAAQALEALFPTSALSWFHIGLAWSSTDLKRSRAATRRAIDLDASFPQPYVAEHLFLMGDGEFDAARKTFERGLDGTEPASAERQQLLIIRAQMALKYDQHDAALDAAERALAIHDSSITVLMLKAKAQRGLGLPEAAATLNRVLELRPAHAEALEMLGR